MLRNKKNLLTKQEINVLDEGRKMYANAFEKRLRNPADFDTNIQCLRDLEYACRSFYNIINTHVDQHIHAKLKSQTSIFNFFRKNASLKSLKEIKIINAARNYMLDGWEPLMKKWFANEPRIIGLIYNENKREDLSSNRVVNFEEKKEYKITFSDHSSILLNDLNQESLAKARMEFAAKMSELALASENRMKLG